MSRILIDKLVLSLEEGELLKAVDDSYSVTAVLNFLGYQRKGQYIKIVKEFLVSNDIDISHFTPNGHPPATVETRKCLVCGEEFKFTLRSDKDQKTCSHSCANTYFRSGKNHPNYKEKTTLNSYRKRALEEYGAVCQLCGYDANIAAIEVHHIDEDRSNNELDNLIVLCSNCHAITHWEKGL